jgi:hypothetical protein
VARKEWFCIPHLGLNENVKKIAIAYASIHISVESILHLTVFPSAFVCYLKFQW